MMFDCSASKTTFAKDYLLSGIKTPYYGIKYTAVTVTS